MPDSPLLNVRVVLYETLDLVNVAATVRAMKNMGLRDLYLVRPAEFDAWRVEGIAHDTADIVDRIRVVESLDEALAECTLVAAFTARGRTARWDVTTPRDVAPRLIEHAAEAPVAVLFGREDRGLPNDALDRANVHVTIPTTAHASLNLAQAVMVAVYELHIAAGDVTRPLKPPRKDAPPASVEQMERYFADAERALEAIEFFKTRFRENIMRSVRSLAFRSDPNGREIELMRAMVIEVVKNLERVKRRLADEPVSADASAESAEAVVRPPQKDPE